VEKRKLIGYFSIQIPIGDSLVFVEIKWKWPWRSCVYATE